MNTELIPTWILNLKSALKWWIGHLMALEVQISSIALTYLLHQTKVYLYCTSISCIPISRCQGIKIAFIRNWQYLRHQKCKSGAAVHWAIASTYLPILPGHVIALRNLLYWKSWTTAFELLFTGACLLISNWLFPFQFMSLKRNESNKYNNIG